MAENGTHVRPKRGYRSTKPLMDSTMVTVTISKDFGEEQQFVLPREYLTTVSEFFEKSFKGSFREAGEKSLKLDDVKAETFRIFIEWLYGRKLLNSDGEEYDGEQDGDKEIEDDGTILSRSRMPELLAMYIFADQFDIPQLRKDALEMFIRYQYSFPTVCGDAVVIHAYNRLPPSSPFLRWLVDLYVYEWRPDPDNVTGYPRRFLEEMVVQQCHRVRVEKSPYKNPAKYNESDGEEEAEK